MSRLVRAFRLVAFAVGLLPGLCWAQASDAHETLGYVLPSFGFDTDDGLGGGLRVEWVQRPEGVSPYQSAWMVQGWATQSGYQDHEFRWERRLLGAQKRMRVLAYGGYRKWLRDGYWGIGNSTVRDASSEDVASEDWYTYGLAQAYGRFVFYQDLGRNGWALYGGLLAQFSVIETYKESLLAEERPYGVEGGALLQPLFGLRVDRRTPEVAPRDGFLLELGGRFSPRLLGESSGFGGPFLSYRKFLAWGERAVWATRWRGEWLFGDVPFYEMVHWGGYVPVAGFGGAETLRGISSGRWRGPGKAIASLELRLDVYERTVRSYPLRFEVAPFGDLGFVFGDDLVKSVAVPTDPVHVGAGLGVRVIVDGTFVGGMDFGVGRDPMFDPAGNVLEEYTPGLYLYADHPF